MLSTFQIGLLIIYTLYTSTESLENVKVRNNSRYHTVLEEEKVQLLCGNVKLGDDNLTIKWYHECTSVTELNDFKKRITINDNGSLIFNTVFAYDSGRYLCEATNDNNETQLYFSHLNVEYPAKISSVPTTQYLSLGKSSILQCYTNANPLVKYVTWTKNRRLFDPNETHGVVVLKNGSLLFEKASKHHEGRYTCTPYNEHGTHGSSGLIEVQVQEYPMITVTPQREDDNITFNDNCISLYEASDMLKEDVSVNINDSIPDSPKDLAVTIVENGVLISWKPSLENVDVIHFYSIKYRTDGDWKTLSRINIPPNDTSYLGKNLVNGKEYRFKVLAVSENGSKSSSEEIRYLHKSRD